MPCHGCVPLSIVVPIVVSESTSNAALTARQGWLLLTVLIASAILWSLVWYGDTVQSMVTTWIQSETFAHGFLILPISGWLIWRKRHQIVALSPRPNFWMLLPLAMVSFGWLLGYLASVVVVQQYCLVLMVVFLVATIVGNQIFKELAFPLLFLLFAVPFGEVLLPILMEYTADFAVLALRLTGIPVYREGLYFTVPSGNWSVVEACSGLRYLIASLTLGVLYAYLTYRRLKFRLIFIALSIVVPIVANWLRAYMIVMIGHLSSMKYAVGVDHLIYGWLFFGVVMLLLFWVGSFWREDDVTEHTSLTLSQYASIGHSLWLAIAAAALMSAGAVAIAPTFASHLQSGSHDQPELQAPAGRGGWQSKIGSSTEWVPRYLNPSARIVQAYEAGTSRTELFVGYYRNQRQSAELIASQNVLVHSGDKVWGSVAESHRTLRINERELRFTETTVRSHNQRLLVWHWYWVDGRYTDNAYWAKLLQAKSQLFGEGDDGAVIAISTSVENNALDGAKQLQKFLDDMLPAISDALAKARKSGQRN